MAARLQRAPIRFPGEPPELPAPLEEFAAALGRAIARGALAAIRAGAVPTAQPIKPGEVVEIAEKPAVRSARRLPSLSVFDLALVDDLRRQPTPVGDELAEVSDENEAGAWARNKVARENSTP